MILTEDFTEKPLISHCSAQAIHIHDKIYENSILITPTGEISCWPTHCIDDITQEHYQQFLAFQPEVIIIGAGLTQSLPDPAFIAYFTRHHIGVEIMNTAAACRTYNVLALENRRVLAILMFKNEVTPSC